MHEATKMRKILMMMLKEDGFTEINTNHQHHVIMDISWRFGQSCAYWGNVELFVRNYINWVETYISIHSTNKHSMWEQWSIMVQKMTLGM